MDNHPIPQDVTNFQFRLIGDMTLKQFAYLAAGVGLAVVCLALPTFLILKIPVALLVGISGAALAFMPYEGRPADVMLMHFLKALLTPNQYMYQRTVAAPTAPQQKVQVAAASPVTQEKKEEKAHEKMVLESVTPVMPTASATTTQPQVNELQEYAKMKQLEEKNAYTTPKPVTQPVKQAEQKLTTQTTTIQSALNQAQQEEAHAPTGSVSAEKAHEKVEQLQGMLQDVLQQKEELEKQFLALQQSLHVGKQGVTPSTMAIPEAAAPKTTTHVRKIPKQLSKSVGLPFTPDVPNLITGIVKDPRGNVLPNIIIEVKDKDDNPVRAFKTNNLGQFASATPIINGTYTITFEDPKGKNNFETVELTANGEILLPIEVISVDQREQLRQELFG